jgi:hypothetical protein
MVQWQRNYCLGATNAVNSGESCSCACKADVCPPVLGASRSVFVQARMMAPTDCISCYTRSLHHAGCMLLDSTQLLCSGARGDITVRVTDVSDLLPPPEDASQDSADCIGLSAWEAAAQQLQQHAPLLLGTKQQVGERWCWRQGITRCSCATLPSEQHWHTCFVQAAAATALSRVPASC